ncbi:Hypothetical protein EAG7_00830 [Klebsiella aerogenes]|nr:Hypothetical protein EAG7_00830 [Klebsiella aerogenes]CCG29387.1 hypothetical protein [Klebsiella aerogenes EA1509E]
MHNPFFVISAIRDLATSIEVWVSEAVASISSSVTPSLTCAIILFPSAETSFIITFSDNVKGSLGRT